MQNTDLTVAIAKANKSEPLTDAETVQLTILADELFVASAMSFASVARAHSIHDRSLEVKYLIDMLEANPGLIPQWERFRSLEELISPEFGSAVDDQLKNIGKTSVA